ncbi:MAG TPA: RNA chaperone Hfq [Terriglobales bacterium]|nr:RNA chaperone Hfq [Terriglobales bacterium]
MKDSPSSTVMGRDPDAEAYGNRRLIRPTLNRNDSHRPENGDRRPERPANGKPTNGAKKAAPPEQTHAENFYYQKQMQSKTPMIIVLQDDEEVRGVIEWYDKYCLKVNRTGEPNLLIYKPSIKYMYKESEAGGHK